MSAQLKAPRLLVALGRVLFTFFLLNACLCVCEVSAVRGIPQQDGRLPFLGRSPRPPSQPHVRGSSGAAGPEMDLYSPRDPTRTLPAQPRRLHRDTGPQIPRMSGSVPSEPPRMGLSLSPRPARALACHYPNPSEAPGRSRQAQAARQFSCTLLKCNQTSVKWKINIQI